MLRTFAGRGSSAISIGSARSAWMVAASMCGVRGSLATIQSSLPRWRTSQLNCGWLALTPRAERPRLLFGHAHELLLGWACEARTGSIIDTSRGAWRTPARCRWPIAASDSAAAAVTADSAQALASPRFGPGLQTRGLLGVAV